jgi:predicted nucleic acid-binding protein
MSENKIFIDSNILICLFDGDSNRKALANSLGNKNYFISTQVVNENVNVCLKKIKLTKAEAFSHGTYLIDNFSLVEITASTIQSAFYISIKYEYNFWDSLILSSAIGCGCNTIYSEDMQHNQIIENKLTIINPFLT